MEALSRFNFNQAVPLLFLGDAPESLTGLGRVGHDLAWLASSMPEFQVGYLGRGAFGRAKYPWSQYSFSIEEQWGEQVLEKAWNDLAGDRKGIIFTVWDASRLLWFADGRGTNLEKFLGSGRFERWGYFMADGAGVREDTLPLEQAHVVSQYDRALMASHWAYTLTSGIEGRNLEGKVRPELDWIPHPLNRDVFRPRGREEVRSAWGLADRDLLIGCVMANQQRKHWPAVIEAVARLERAKLWIHTDTPLAYWNLHALAVEYGMEFQIIMEHRGLTDRELAMRYSACDATVVISGGEGFCYPVAESMSCGTPCVTGAYGAQAELTGWTVPPVASIIDTSHNVRRAVYKGLDVWQKLLQVFREKPAPEVCERYVQHLNMAELGLVWKKWFKKGLYDRAHRNHQTGS
jgi:glycosyltransferase involved in cell wall biosynthesis